MRFGADPCLWLILADPEHPSRGLDFCRDAPPSDERTRQCGALPGSKTLLHSANMAFRPIEAAAFGAQPQWTAGGT
jgi:hypothetical protein